jgi:HK97 gp10 family phage protein
MADAITMTFDDAALQAALTELGAKATEFVRPAAQAGAQVLYDEVKVNAEKIRRKTGNLASSIYQAYSQDNSDNTRATYHVSWNARKAPHGHLVEFGHLQTRKAYIGSDGKWYTSKEKLPEPKHVAAQPFVRPAYDAKRTAALQVSKETFLRLMREVMP